MKTYILFLLLLNRFGCPKRKLKSLFSNYIEFLMLKESKNQAESVINPKLLEIWEKIQKEATEKFWRDRYIYEEFISDLKSYAVTSKEP